MSDFLHESKIREMTNELFDENGYPNIKEYTEGQIRDAFNSGYAVGQEEGAEFEVVKALEDVKAFIDKDIIFYDLIEREKLIGFIDHKIAELKPS